MASKQTSSADEVWPQLFDCERDIEENVSDREDNVEEDPLHEASFSDQAETLSLDPPVVLHHPAD